MLGTWKPDFYATEAFWAVSVHRLRLQEHTVLFEWSILVSGFGEWNLRYPLCSARTVWNKRYSKNLGSIRGIAFYAEQLGGTVHERTGATTQNKDECVLWRSWWRDVIFHVALPLSACSNFSGQRLIDQRDSWLEKVLSQKNWHKLS